MPSIGRSDHIGIRFDLTVYTPNCYNPTPHFQFHKAQYDEMCEELDQIEWESELRDKGVEEAWNIFVDTLTDKMKKFIPMSNPKHCRKKQRWMKRGPQETEPEAPCLEGST